MPKPKDTEPPQVPDVAAHEPSEAVKQQARDFHFAVLHSMADLDSHRHSELMTTADRPTLEWAYYYMAQTMFAVMSDACGGDLDRTVAAIRDLVQAMETRGPAWPGHLWRG